MYPRNLAPGPAFSPDRARGLQPLMSYAAPHFLRWSIPEAVCGLKSLKHFFFHPPSSAIASITLSSTVIGSFSFRCVCMSPGIRHYWIVRVRFIMNWRHETQRWSWKKWLYVTISSILQLCDPGNLSGDSFGLSPFYFWIFRWGLEGDIRFFNKKRYRFVCRDTMYIGRLRVSWHMDKLYYCLDP